MTDKCYRCGKDIIEICGSGFHSHRGYICKECNDYKRQIEDLRSDLDDKSHAIEMLLNENRALRDRIAELEAMLTPEAKEAQDGK